MPSIRADARSATTLMPMPIGRRRRGLVAIDQSAPVVVRHLQIGITDQAVQPQSP
jgi:hypothetical protein